MIARRAVTGFALVVLLPLLAAAQEPAPVTVEVAGEARTEADLRDLADQAKEAVAALESATLPEEARARTKDALQEEVAALGELAAQLAEVRSIPERKARIEAEIAAAKQSLEKARAAAGSPEVPATISEQQITEYVAAAEKAKQEIGLAEDALTAATTSAQTRRERFDKASETFAALRKTREGLQAELAREDLPPADRPALEAKLVTNEVRLRIHELSRDHHADLAALDDLAVQLARVRSDLAKAEAGLAEARLTNASTVRERQLAEEARRAKEEAEKQKQRAERLKDEPASRAVASLQALVADFEARAGEEKALEVKVAGQKRVADSLADRTKERNEAVKQRLPLSVELDDLRRSFLVEQRAWLDQQIEDRRAWRERTEADLAEAQRTAIRERDRVAALRIRMEEEAAREELPGEEPLRRRPPGTGRIDDYQARWLGAVHDFETGIGELADWERKYLQPRWDQASANLEKLIPDRLARLERIEKLAGEGLDAVDRATKLLAARRAYLDEVSFWLREDSPLAAERLDRARQELPWLISELPAIAARPLASLRDRGLVLLDGLAVLVALLAVPAVLLRRRIRAAAARGTEAEGDAPLSSFLWSAVRVLLRPAPALLIFAAGLLLFRKVLPADPLVTAALSLLALLSGYLLLTGTTDALIRYYARSDAGGDAVGTGRRARKIFRVGILGLALLLPAMVLCDRAGAKDLATALGLVLYGWGWLMAAWLVFRRDVLSFFIPAKEDSRLSTSLRNLIRRGWPLLVLFLLLVGVLDFLGYRTAARNLALRSLLCVAVLAAANVVYQLLHAVIVSRTGGAEEETGPPSEDESEPRRLARSLLGSVLFVLILVGTWIGVTWALGITPARWSEWGAKEIIPGTTFGNVFTALAILAVTILGASYLRQLLQLLLSQVRFFREGTRYTLSTLLFYALVTVGVLMSIQGLGVKLSELTWFLAPMGVAVGFGLTQIFSNFVSGLILFFERPVQVGDIITVGDVEGDVKKISIRATVVQTRDGVSIILPNRKLIEEEVTNWSHSGARTRIHIGVGVAYGSDVELVKRVLTEVADADPRVLKRPRPEVDFEGFGESELSFDLLVWLGTPDSTIRRRTRTALNFAIDAAFRREGIEIPFPQRDLHVKTLPPRFLAEEE